MTETVTTKIPQTVDQVCRAQYGDETGYVEAVLAANPGLASQPLILPAGTTIILPEVTLEAESNVVTLWD